VTSRHFRPNDFRHRADAVRSIPLATVLTRWGAQRDRYDRDQWRTERGPLSVTGAQFYNWHCHEGGGGAIDLVMHLGDMDVSAAIEWLQQHLDATPVAPPSTLSGLSASSSRARAPTTPGGFCPPSPDRTRLDRVRRYLTERRCLAADFLDPLIANGKVYADRRGNAVFLMVAGKANRPIGAELRGSGERSWRGLAPGTGRDAGYFWIGERGAPRIVLCESAIDAISCFQLYTTQLHAECICISTAGVRPDAPWLSPLMARGLHIYCGFDNDEAGERVSRQMITRHRSIKRLRPPAHDWNDALVASR